MSQDGNYLTCQMVTNTLHWYRGSSTTMPIPSAYPSNMVMVESAANHIIKKMGWVLVVNSDLTNGPTTMANHNSIENTSTQRHSKHFMQNRFKFTTELAIRQYNHDNSATKPRPICTHMSGDNRSLTIDETNAIYITHSNSHTEWTGNTHLCVTCKRPIKYSTKNLCVYDY